MKGGPEPPCENDRLLERIREAARRRGDLQQCPRVDLEPGNSLAADLISLATDRELAAFAGAYFDRMTADLEPHDLQAILRRVAGALHDAEANAIRFPKAPTPPGLSRKPPAR